MLHWQLMNCPPISLVEYNENNLIDVIMLSCVIILYVGDIGLFYFYLGHGPIYCVYLSFCKLCNFNCMRVVVTWTSESMDECLWWLLFSVANEHAMWSRKRITSLQFSKVPHVYGRGSVVSIVSCRRTCTVAVKPVNWEITHYAYSYRHTTIASRSSL